MSPEHVLHVIRDEYRYACEFDTEASPGYDLTFDSSIQDWRNACDLRSLRGLGKALNQQYGLTLTHGQWKDVLAPASVRTLREVCEVVAAHASIPLIEPSRLFGSKCLPAGVFLALRARLRQNGIDVGTLRPKHTLPDRHSKLSDAIMDSVRLLGPGSLPVPTVRQHSLVKPLAIVTMVSILGVVLVQMLRLVDLDFGAAGIFLFGTYFCGLIAIAAINRISPAEIEWGNARTYGDIARLIATADELTPNEAGEAGADEDHD